MQVGAVELQVPGAADHCSKLPHLPSSSRSFRSPLSARVFAYRLLLVVSSSSNTITIACKLHTLHNTTHVFHLFMLLLVCKGNSCRQIEVTTALGVALYRGKAVAAGLQSLHLCQHNRLSRNQRSSSAQRLTRDTAGHARPCAWTTRNTTVLPDAQASS